MPVLTQDGESRPEAYEPDPYGRGLATLDGKHDVYAYVMYILLHFVVIRICYT